MSLSPDGERLVTCGSDRTLRVYRWRGESLDELWYRESPPGTTSYAHQFSPDGTTLAVAYRTWKERPKDGSDTHLEGSPTGYRIPFVDTDRLVLLRSQTGEEAHSFDSDEPISGFAFLADGTAIVFARHNRLCRYNIAEAKIVKRRSTRDRVTDPTVLSDGSAILALLHRRWTTHIVVFDPIELKRITRLYWNSDEFACLRVSAARRLTVFSERQRGDTYSVSILPMEGTRGVASFAGGRSVTLSPNGRRAAYVLGRGPTIRILDTERNMLLHDDYQQSPASSVTMSRDGAIVACNGCGNRIRIWDTETGTILSSFETKDFVTSVALSGDGSHLAVAAGSVALYALPEGSPVRTAHPPKDAVKKIRLSPDGTHLACTEPYYGAYLTSLNGASDTVSLNAGTGATKDVAFSGDGELCATAVSDDDAYDDVSAVYNARSGELLAEIRIKNMQCAVAFSDDGSVLAIGDDVIHGDGSAIWLWDWQKNSLLRKIPGHATRVARILFVPGTQFLVSSGDDNAARLWNATTGELVHAFEGDWGGISDLAVSADGTRLASAMGDSTVMVWDLTSFLSARHLR